MWIKWGKIVDINQKRKRNRVDLSFCKQAKWNDPGCNPCGVRREATDEDRAPQRCRSSQRAGMRTRGGAASRESSDQSWQAASHHKRVNSEACGRGSFSCRKLEMKSKVSIMKWENRAQGGQVTFPRSHSDVRGSTWTLVSSLQVILSSHSAGTANARAYRVRQATEMQEAGQMWETIGRRCPREIQWSHISNLKFSSRHLSLD